MSIPSSALESSPLSPGPIDMGSQRGGPFTRHYRACMAPIDRLARWLVFIVLLAELALILIEVSQRFVANHSFLWAEEASRLALLSLAFVGGALAYRAHNHAAITVVTRLFPVAVRDMVSALVDMSILTVAGVLLFTSIDLYQINSQSVMPILQWSLGLTVLPMITGMTLVILFAFEQLLAFHSRRSASWALAVILVVTLATLAIQSYPQLQPSAPAALALLLIVFFGSILLGLPVAFAMLLGSILFLTATDLAPLVAVTQNTIDGAGHFILLTLPFFIWAGLIMERGGISLRLVNFAMALVGHFRGGLLQVVIMTTYLVSGVSARAWESTACTTPWSSCFRWASESSCRRWASASTWPVR